MGDPLGAARRIREALAPDGTWLLVEPMAGETFPHNANTVRRIFYAASTFISTPAAQAQDGGYALGAQVPEATLAQILGHDGLGRFRMSTETPFVRVFEARP